jgi:Transglycosylase SLT domain
VPKLRHAIPVLTVHGHKIAVSSLAAAAVACGVFGATVGSAPPAHAATGPGSTAVTDRPGSGENSAHENSAHENSADDKADAASARLAALRAAAKKTAAPTASPAGDSAQAPVNQPATAQPAAAPAVTPPPDPYAGLSPQQDAAMIVPADQLDAFDWIIEHESGWDVTAVNPSSGAYGLGQALPAIKMAPYGADYLTDPVTQIRWALAYMDERYGSPDSAQAFWEANGWY